MKTPREARILVVLWLLLGLMLGTGLALAQEGGGAKPKMPADFTLPKDAKSPGVVTFSHEKHFDKGNKCPDCHAKLGMKMKKGTSGAFTMAAMKEGKQCGACHDGTKSFSVQKESDCAKCHAGAK